MDKNCLLTFFSVPLIFTNYLNTNNLCIYSIFIRRATKRGKKYSSERRNRIKSRFDGDFPAKESSLTSTNSQHTVYDKYSHNHKTSAHSAG